MSFRTTALAGLVALSPALASAQMIVEDAYARAGSAVAISGAAFMEITNPTDTDDRLVLAESDIAERVELHTHIQTDEGVMRMVELEDGIPLPAGETVLLARGGLHVMFLGLRQPLTQGDRVMLTLRFDHATPVSVMVPVDLERQPGHGGMGHGAMGHSHSHGAGSHTHGGQAEVTHGN